MIGFDIVKDHMLLFSSFPFLFPADSVSWIGIGVWVDIVVGVVGLIPIDIFLVGVDVDVFVDPFQSVCIGIRSQPLSVVENPCGPMVFGVFLFCFRFTASNFVLWCFPIGYICIWWGGGGVDNIFKAENGGVD